MPLGDRDRALLVDVASRARFTAGIVPIARGDAASLAGPERRFEVLAGARCFQRLLIADIDPGRTVRRLGAFLGAVDLAQFKRIDAELAGELVDTAFDREGADRRAGRPA